MLLDETSDLQFYGNMLMQMNFREDSSVKTAGVELKGGKITFRYNKEWCEKLNYIEAIYLISHEILHIAFQHHKRTLNKGGKVSMRDNVSMDLAINSLLGEPPMKGCYPGQGDFAKLPMNKSYEYYYTKLPDDEEDNGGGGGMYGNIPQEQGKGNIGDFETHTWKDDNPLNDLAVNEALDQAMAKSQGHMPGSLEEAIRKNMKVKVDWKQQLKRFVGDFFVVGTEPTKKRVDRRIPLWGVVPGKTSKYCSKILVGIDTSASVSQPELSAFITIISQMKIPISIVQCDTEIQKVMKVRSPRDLNNFKAVGRGGTDFQPVFDYAKKHKFQGVIYLTDMECNFPDKYGKPCLWVSTQKEYDQPPFGKVIYLDVGGHDYEKED